MRFLRLGLCALISFAVLAHGGVEDWARAVLQTGVAFLFLIWALRFYFNEQEQPLSSPLLPPLALFFLVGLGQWFFRATASSFSTRVELLLLLATLLFLFLCVQAFRTLQDWRTFVWFGMGLGFVISVFGILQHLTFNGKLYWVRELTYGGIPFGPYVNRNHFAGLMELLIPLALVPLVLGKVRRERLAVVGLFAIMPIAALFLSASRGGIVSFFVQFTLLVYLLLRRRGLAKRLLAVSAVLLAALMIVTWLGVGRILQQCQQAVVGRRGNAEARLDVGEITPHEANVSQRDRGEHAVRKRDPVQHAALDGEAGLRQAVPLQLADRAAGNRDLRTTEEVVATRDGRIDGQVGSASISEFLPRLAASHRARV